MRRLEIPRLMFIEPHDSRRMYVPAAVLLAAAWHRAFAKPTTRRRLNFTKKEVA
jgi:hypothetical protein